MSLPQPQFLELLQLCASNKEPLTINKQIKNLFAFERFIIQLLLPSVNVVIIGN